MDCSAHCVGIAQQPPNTVVVASTVRERASWRLLNGAPLSEPPVGSLLELAALAEPLFAALSSIKQGWRSPSPSKRHRALELAATRTSKISQQFFTLVKT